MNKFNSILISSGQKVIEDIVKNIRMNSFTANGIAVENMFGTSGNSKFFENIEVDIDDDTPNHEIVINYKNGESETISVFEFIYG